MRFANASVLFFLLASGALMALALLRHRAQQSESGDRYVALAALAMLLHPLVWWIADSLALKGDLTPFFAFDLIAACAIATAAAGHDQVPAELPGRVPARQCRKAPARKHGGQKYVNAKR